MANRWEGASRADKGEDGLFIHGHLSFGRDECRFEARERGQRSQKGAPDSILKIGCSQGLLLLIPETPLRMDNGNDVIEARGRHGGPRPRKTLDLEILRRAPFVSFATGL